MRSLLASLGLAVLLFTTPARLDASREENKFGGYQTVKDDSGNFWFEQSDGTRFLSLGINHIVEAHDFQAPDGSTYYNPIPKQFRGSHDAWRESVVRLLNNSNFNTIGAWSSPRVNDGSLYEMPILYVAGHSKERVLHGLLPGFKDMVRRRAAEVLEEIQHPEKVVGVFLDNEMAWYGRSPWDPNPRYTVLEEAMTLPPGNPARGVALGFLQLQYETAEAFSQAWDLEIQNWEELTAGHMSGSGSNAAMEDREQFLAAAADAFYGKSAEVLKKEYPGLLLLGTRFAGDAPDPVIEACAEYCDVVSFNNYRARPEADERLLARYWLLSEKPLMITEYSWRSDENTSGNPNTGGAGRVVATQQARADAYSSFVRDNFRRPMIIGMHWFEFSDQSPQGRFDGENSNYGVVDIYHRPYETLLAAMRKTNEAVRDIHAGSDLELPTSMPPLPKVVVDPGQYPNRPAKLNLLARKPVEGPARFSADDASISYELERSQVVAQINTGATWGCGLTFFGPEEFAKPEPPAKATNIDGYSAITLDAEMPEGLQFQIILDEAGVDSPTAAEYDTSGGDDGESFSFAPVSSNGGRQQWRFELADLAPRNVWGNQLGERRVDLDSLKGPGIVFLPSLPKAEVVIHSLNFEK